MPNITNSLPETIESPEIECYSTYEIKIEEIINKKKRRSRKISGTINGRE
jgi:hypothetical protein